METNINQQREMLLIDALDQAVILLDAEGRIQHANPIACSALGHPLESLRNQQLHEHFVLSEETIDNTSAVCLRPIDNGILKTSFICGDHVKKLHLPNHTGQTTIALLWCPIRQAVHSVHTRDHSTGLPDRNMLIQQLNPLLTQSHLANPHSLVKIQISEIGNDHLDAVASEQLESLMTDIAALLAPNIRQRDLLSRAGSDCFVLLLRGCDLEHAKGIVIKLMDEIQAYHDDYPDTHLPPWRICTGIIPLISGSSIEETFTQAKKACKQACASREGIAISEEGKWENLS